MDTSFKRGIKAIYSPKIWSQNRGGYSFDLELTKNVKIVGEGYGSPEERDDAAKEVCKEFNLILTQE